LIGNKTGKLGEDIAEKHLINKGFKILHKNYWQPYGEIDIICQKGKKLYFVEVKSVSVTPNTVSHENIRPEDNVHKSKLKKIARVVEVFLSQNKYKTMDWQFDVAIVYIDKPNKKASVRMIENQILEARN
jgi:putative endonuclease